MMATSACPSLEDAFSIGYLINIDNFNMPAKFTVADVLFQMLLSREVTLRLDKTKQKWFGGITTRIILDLVAAELWANSMELHPKTSSFLATEAVKTRQIEGIVKFAEEMQWPYLNEIQATGKKLLGPDVSQLAIDIRTFDWLNGLTLPGAFFPMAIVGTLYAMSPSLHSRMPSAIIQARKGCYGIVYPQASYWSVRSIVGKVMAPLSKVDTVTGKKVKCLGAWVGPCISSSLPESTFGILIEPKNRPPPWVLENPATDSKPPNITGVHSTQNSDWTLPEPPAPRTSTRNITLQTLRLTKVVGGKKSETAEAEDSKSLPVYQAQVTFRLDHIQSVVTISLHVNSVFLASMPCQGGPHRIDPLAADVYASRVLEIENLPSAELDSHITPITVINASGDPIEKSLARAWCSEKGVNAVLWKRQGGCCYKCALMLASSEGLATGVLISC